MVRAPSDEELLRAMLAELPPPDRESRFGMPHPDHVSYMAQLVRGVFADLDAPYTEDLIAGLVSMFFSQVEVD